MSIKPQKCSLCKKAGHNKKKCPGTSLELEVDTPLETEETTTLDINFILSNQEPVTDDDCIIRKNALKAKKDDKLNLLRKSRMRKPGEKYFFQNVNIAVDELFERLMEKPETKSFIIIAPPGSGKPSVMDKISYRLQIDNLTKKNMYGDRISVFTGMSSVDCKKQIQENLSFIYSNDCPFEVRHNPDICKRIDYLIENPLLLKLVIPSNPELASALVKAEYISSVGPRTESTNL